MSFTIGISQYLDGLFITSFFDNGLILLKERLFVHRIITYQAKTLHNVVTLLLF